MTTPPPSPRRIKTVRFSPVLLAVALTPVFLQTSTISCKSGITTLSELEVIVDGQDIVDGFDPNVRSYSAAVPPGTDEAMVHAMSTDPDAQVWIDVVVDGERERYLHGGLGGGDLIVSLPLAQSTIEVWIRAPKGATGSTQSMSRRRRRSPAPSKASSMPLRWAVGRTRSTATGRRW